MVRVTYCLTSMLLGGTELNAIRTVEGLDRSRFHVTVVVLSTEGPLLDRYRAAGIDVRTFDTPSFYHPRHVTATLKLVRFLKENRTQVLHAHSIYANVFGVPAGVAAGVPCIISSRRWWKRGVSRPLLIGNSVADRLAHRVLANSQGVADIVEQDGIDAGKIAVIPNFVDDEGFEPPAPNSLAGLRSKIGVEPGQKVLGIVARLTGIKDHKTLIEAFSKVAGSHPDWVLAIVGDGDERDALEAQVAQLGLAERVRFAGSLPHQPSAHHAFDLSVLCSVSEGFPNSVVEAMAARKAVIGTDVGGVPDAIANEVTGLLVAPQSVSALVGAMDRLMRDDGARSAMGDAGFLAAKEHFSKERVLHELESLYRGVLGMRRDGAT
jgi:glycosyltransferase involved in cell wall biosynthesis